MIVWSAMRSRLQSQPQVHDTRVRDALRFALAAMILVITPLSASATRIVMMGDSITLGTVSSGLPDVDPAYPAQVDALLGPGFDVEVAACGGTVARQWRPP